MACFKKQREKSDSSFTLIYYDDEIFNFSIYVFISIVCTNKEGDS